jgi:Ca2+-binding RTX toxin-like protein
MRIFSADDFDQVALNSPGPSSGAVILPRSFGSASAPALEGFSAAAATTYGDTLSYGGHYYRLATSIGITRAAALAEASASSFTLNGQTYQGHLVTVTTSGEEAFIEAAIRATNNGTYFGSEPSSYWMGGEYVTSTWRWTSGLEDGQALTYSNWSGSEASQGATDPYLTLNMYAGYVGNNWLSVPNSYTSGIRGYVIEYRDMTAPTVPNLPSTPSIAINANLTVTFSEAIAKGSGFVEIHSGSATGPLVERFDVTTSFALRFSGSNLVIDPTSNLNPGTQYFVTFASGAVKDLDGNAYSGNVYAFNSLGVAITGTAENDTLTGTIFDENISGLSGNDTIYGLEGNDVIDGGDGSDAIYGSNGADTITSFFIRNTTPNLFSNNYTYVVDADYVDGGDGDDTIYFLGGQCFGGAGNDNIIVKGPSFPTKSSMFTFSYSISNSYIYSGLGDDLINIDGNMFHVFIESGEGNDRIITNSANCTTSSGSGDDYISAIGGDIDAGSDNDYVLIAGLGRNYSAWSNAVSAFNVRLGVGDDKLSISINNGLEVYIDGGDGWDEVIFTGYTGTLNLNNISNHFKDIEVFTIGTAVSEFLGRDVGDFIVGTGFRDVIKGMIGDDQIYGGDGDDYIEGDEGNDLLSGEGADDTIVGGEGDDRLEGGAGNDSLYGGVGTDLVFGGSGGDVVYAGDGNDTAYGDVGNDQINGDDGNDILYGNDGNDFLGGGLGDDSLIGGAGDDGLAGGDGNDSLDGGDDNDTLLGQAGDDTISGGLGQDFIDAGDGIDTVNAGDANDLINGGFGNDIINGEAGNDSIYGDAGNDIIDGGAGDDDLSGGNDNDTITGGAGDDRIAGGYGNDILNGGEGSDTISANDGDDTITGGAGVDNLYGFTGNDYIDGGDGNDTLLGMEGDDTVTGGAGADYIVGGDGADRLSGDDGDDNMQGNDGNDTLNGGLGNDGLDGGTGNDTLNGDAGNDYLGGGEGNDILNGGEGNDVFVGGAGKDTLTGGAGADAFFFTSLTDSTSAATDKITDFSLANGDYINLSQIDANNGQAGDQAFSFVNSFTKQAGQATLTYDAASNTSTFSADVDGDGVADFVLQINGQQDTSNGWVL